jgi:hypothetical protein
MHAALMVAAPSRTEGKASSSQGMSSQPNRPTSRLSSPAAMSGSRSETRAVEQLHLAELLDRVDRQQPVKLDRRTGLLARLARCPVLRALMLFQIAGRNCPEPMTRFDGAATEQNLLTCAHHRSDHDARVFVVHEPAMAAHRVEWVSPEGVTVSKDGAILLPSAHEDRHSGSHGRRRLAASIGGQRLFDFRHHDLVEIA